MGKTSFAHLSSHNYDLPIRFLTQEGLLQPLHSESTQITRLATEGRSPTHQW